MLTNDELDEYIVNNFTAVMNAEEQQAYIFLQWVKNSQLDGLTFAEALRKWKSSRLEVDALMAGGREVLLKRVRDRVLAEEREKRILNRCPRCGKLARTPGAKQCRHCFHSWHDE